ncbi:MAG: hypothetical protein AAGE94_13015 [Acidobacteriota bacterium]
MTKHQVELEDARDMMLLAAAVFERWDGRLAEVAELLPNPHFAPETDDPVNLAAAWQASIQATLSDELEPAIGSLRRAASWREGTTPWQTAG